MSKKDNLEIHIFFFFISLKIMFMGEGIFKHEKERFKKVYIKKKDGGGYLQTRKGKIQKGLYKKERCKRASVRSDSTSF